MLVCGPDILLSSGGRFPVLMDICKAIINSNSNLNLYSSKKLGCCLKDRTYFIYIFEVIKYGQALYVCACALVCMNFF